MAEECTVKRNKVEQHRSKMLYASFLYGQKNLVPSTAVCHMQMICCTLQNLCCLFSFALEVMIC